MPNKTKSQLLNSLDAFTKAYLECALWSSMDNANARGGEPLDANYDVSDFTIKALEKCVADCADFQTAQRENLAQAPYINNEEYRASERAGHDFWLSRNGHGAGFFDRGSEPIWDTLQDAAETCGEVNIKVYRGKLHI